MSKGRNSAAKKPDTSWIVGTIVTVPTLKAKPFVVRLESVLNGCPIALLYRKTAKKLDLDALRVGTSILCDVSEHDGGRSHRIRHCVLAP
jgi:hypothetical protein